MLVATYCKRFRMERTLREVSRVVAPIGYELVPWEPELLEAHAEVKYRSFRYTLDADLFPNLGQLHGCVELMRRIADHEGFVPEATWLVRDANEYCGCIQGIASGGTGMIQNIAVLAEHRRQGLGSALLAAALDGFRRAGMTTVALDVSERNFEAVRLYRSFGFVSARTSYRERREEYAAYCV